MHLYYMICLLYILWNLNTKLTHRYIIVIKHCANDVEHEIESQMRIAVLRIIVLFCYCVYVWIHIVFTRNSVLNIKHGWNKKSVTNPSLSIEYSLTFRNCLVGDIAFIYFNKTVQFKLWMYEKNKRAFY